MGANSLIITSLTAYTVYVRKHPSGLVYVSYLVRALHPCNARCAQLYSTRAVRRALDMVWIPTKCRRVLVKGGVITGLLRPWSFLGKLSNDRRGHLARDQNMTIEQCSTVMFWWAFYLRAWYRPSLIIILQNCQLYGSKFFLLQWPVGLHLYTVIRFESIKTKFGICTLLGLNGTLVEVFQVRILASKSVPCRLTTVQMPNLALI